MQGARRLIAVTGPELRHPQRQFAVRPLALIEDLDVAWTVHGLEAEHLALDRLADEHVGPVLLPVARLLPEGAVQHLGCLDLDIAGGVEAAAHIGLQHAPQHPAFGVPEDHAPALFLHVEQAHGLADAAVVALLGLLDAEKIGVQIGLRRPGRRIDALQLGVAVVAAPVGARQLGQLEGLADEFGRGEVRSPAQVLPGALVIDADVLGRRQVADDLGLVAFAHGLETGDGLVARQHLAADLLVTVDDLGHPLFDPGEVVGREGLVAGEIVIEAVLDCGADRDLGSGEQLLHGLGHHMAGVVAQGVERLRRVAHDDLQRAGAADGRVEVQQLAVQLDQGGLLGQGRRDRGRDVAARGVGRILAHGAVGEFQVDHRSVVFTGGTGSYPDPPKGWHLQRRRTVSHPPLTGPCWISASRP